MEVKKKRIVKRLKHYNQGYRKHFGDMAENHVRDFLREFGEVTYNRNHHYDILFSNKIHIEVKSTQLGILRTGYKVRRVNHGWTLYQDAHQELMKERHPYYCLVLMLDDEILCFRFLRADKALSNLTNNIDSSGKPRIRLGALYKSLTPDEFIQTAEELV